MSIEEFVVFNVLDSESSGWFEYQAALHEVSGCWWKARREFVFEIYNLLKCEILTASLERRSASQKLVYNAAESPQVASLTGVLVCEKLRAHIFSGTDK
jgi:hypothetical protein